MRKMKRIVMLVVFSLAIGFVSANSVKDTSITEFIEVVKIVNQKIKLFGESEILIVLDIDNTLLTSHVDLGGDVWYQWQTGKLDLKPTKEQKVGKCLYKDAIGLLYELGTMDLTDTLIPEYIHSWQDTGITVFALTSRSPRDRTATERELKKKEIDFSKTALKAYGECVPIYRYNMQKDMSYMNGIMMTTGMDKGKMLAHILEKTGRSFEAIVFVDDSKKNVDAVKRKFYNAIAIDFTIFHYEKIIEDRKRANGGVILTKEQAGKMAEDWKELNKILNMIFPGRNINGECVSPD